MHAQAAPGPSAPAAVLERALSEMEEDEGEARSVAEKYLRGKEKTKENIYKAYKYLISRGFSYDTAKAAVDFSDDDI